LPQRLKDPINRTNKYTKVTKFLKISISFFFTLFLLYPEAFFFFEIAYLIVFNINKLTLIRSDNRVGVINLHTVLSNI
jgi:hypothetical protein